MLPLRVSNCPLKIEACFLGNASCLAARYEALATDEQVFAFWTTETQGRDRWLGDSCKANRYRYRLQDLALALEGINRSQRINRIRSLAVEVVESKDVCLHCQDGQQANTQPESELTRSLH